MALTCAMTLNTTSPFAVGGFPPPMATLTVANPNAVAVAVTAVQIQFFDAGGNPLNAPINPPSVNLAPGTTTVIPALGTLAFGPLPIVVRTAGDGSLFLAQPATTPPAAPFPRQAAMPTSYTMMIGALVYGSDGSVNVASQAGLLVQYTPLPPVGTQGGVAQFNQPFNSSLVAVVT